MSDVFQRACHSREFALLISVDSLGSNQTFFFPHFSTLAARRFCRRRVLGRGGYKGQLAARPIVIQATDYLH